MSAVTVEAPDELAKVVTELDLAMDSVDLESVLDHNLEEASREVGSLGHVIACEEGRNPTTDDVRHAMTKLGALLDAKDKLDQR